MDFIVSTLIENQICFGGEPLQGMPSLISYFSSSGGLLEVLNVLCSPGLSLSEDDFAAPVATSCPKLTRFVALRYKPCSIETLRRLCEQCPHLQDVSLGGVVTEQKKTNSLTIEVKGRDDDWAICLCLSHALRIKQYMKVTLSLKDIFHYHPVRNLKSMLKSYQVVNLVRFQHGYSITP
eukprot:scaffold334_cov173-Ochromonas_danica.AAC.4